MIHFTNPKLYVKNICSAQAKDVSTGDILFASDKFNTGNVSFSVNADPLRAGMGNPIATIVESDPDITVNFTQADFNMYAKMAAVGGSVAYNAVTPVCQVVTPTTNYIQIDVSDGVPVAPYGYNDPICYIQKAGETSEIGVLNGAIEGGKAYSISGAGRVSDIVINPLSPPTLKVWYYVAKPASMVGTINSLMNSKVVNFEAQMAVYSNITSGTNQGTRVGWLYLVVPMLKLSAEGGNLTGDNSNYDTTVITGRAMSEDETLVSATCSDCTSSNLAYYIYAPDDGADQIVGVAYIGGAISLPVSSTAQMEPQLVMANGQLVALAPSQFTYVGSGLPAGTSVDTDGVVSSGATSGDGEITISYDNNGTTLTCPVNVSVVSA